MKKLAYVLAVTAFGLASCGGGKGYTVTGTVEGAINGDTVFLMERSSRQFIPVDTAILANGKFTFTGKQDSAVNRYLVYAPENQTLYLDFFLENGTTSVIFEQGKGGKVIAGTPMNTAYQTFKDAVEVSMDKQKAIYDSMGEVSDAERAVKMKEMDAAEKELNVIIKNGIQANFNSKLGVFLLNSYNYYLEYDALGELLTQVPEQYQNDANIVRLKDLVATAQKTAVGQKFTDLEMAKPDGTPVKLSDYAGKGKIVLVDFWASWCGPCRREMPNLVDAYAKYKNKGFEIVGVSFDRDEASWKKGLEDLNMTWPQMSDLKYWESDGARVYAIRSIPHVMLIDGEGTIIARNLHGAELYDKLAELLK